MPDEVEAADAFARLADPTRIAILRAFAEALDRMDVATERPVRPVLAFSEVYDRVDVDSTSQLSYHLEELEGTYLQRVDDGWRFTFAGEAVVRLFLSGAYRGTPEFDPVRVDGRCVYCDAEALYAVVEDLVLFRECDACGRRMGGVPVTPAQVRDRDEASLLESTRTRFASHFRRFREDVCTECGGAVDIEFWELPLEETTGSEDAADVADGEGPSDVDDAEENTAVRDEPDASDVEDDEHGSPASGADGAGAREDDAPHRRPIEWTVVGRCRQCWRSINGPPSMWLSNHPASVAFHWEHGVDVLSVGYRELSERVGSGDWRTAPAGDGEYEVTFEVDGAELRLTVDEELTVLASRRVRRDQGLDR